MFTTQKTPVLIWVALGQFLVQRHEKSTQWKSFTPKDNTEYGVPTTTSCSWGHDLRFEIKCIGKIYTFPRKRSIWTLFQSENCILLLSLCCIQGTPPPESAQAQKLCTANFSSGTLKTLINRPLRLKNKIFWWVPVKKKHVSSLPRAWTPLSSV